jgi:hypothetical protein
MILHSYSNPYALSILRAIYPSMSPNSRILIMDQLVPPLAGTQPEPLERMNRTQDLQMVLLCNSHERDEMQWRELIDQVVEDDAKGEGRKLGILGIRSPPESMFSMIEVGFIN